MLKDYTRHGQFYALAVSILGFGLLLAGRSGHEIPAPALFALVATLIPLWPFAWAGRPMEPPANRYGTRWGNRDWKLTYFLSRPKAWRFGWLAIAGAPLLLGSEILFGSHPYETGELTFMFGLLLLFMGYHVVDMASVVAERAAAQEARAQEAEDASAEVEEPRRRRKRGRQREN